MNPYIESIIEEIFSLYDQFGYESYGEDVTQIEHMYQSAKLASEGGFDDEVILAAFLHDIGHLYAGQMGKEQMEEFGGKSHDEMGAEYLLNRGFSSKVAALVKGHVQAKRYLTFKDPSYYSELSAASKKTLSFQGGKMNEKEAREFENDSWFDLSIQMRKWDEAAKEPNVPISNLDIIKQMMRDHLNRQHNEN